jgi:hypothetical protein
MEAKAAQMYSSKRCLRSSSLPRNLLVSLITSTSSETLTQSGNPRPDGQFTSITNEFCALTTSHVSSTVRTTSSIHRRSSAVRATRRSILGSEKVNETFSIWLSASGPAAIDLTHVHKQIEFAVPLLRDNLVCSPRQPRFRSQRVDLLQRQVRLKKGIRPKEVQSCGSQLSSGY